MGANLRAPAKVPATSRTRVAARVARDGNLFSGTVRVLRGSRALDLSDMTLRAPAPAATGANPVLAELPPHATSVTASAEHNSEPTSGLTAIVERKDLNVKHPSPKNPPHRRMASMVLVRFEPILLHCVKKCAVARCHSVAAGH